MCRLAFIINNSVDKKLITELFIHLNKSMGGDGMGLGWFKDSLPHIFKGKEFKPEDAALKYKEIESDNGILFHCRRASVGPIDDDNCHPYMYGNTITIHNGHIDGAGVLKLMMLENLDKYSIDGWTSDMITNSTDSNIMAYFIWKKGFNIVSLLAPGTVITMYPDKTMVHVGSDLEAINVGGVWIFASEFPEKMAMFSDQWVVFGKDTEIIVSDVCTITQGYCIDGKKLYLEKQKKNKNKAR